ncbi:endolysin [Gordonia phage William]|uniref:Lysin A, L-Ala-D-Glu peptidase domain n=1 Tax=Gordonia phage William TaxID=2571253 RepID=A0A4Y6EGH4_9CAUD|nr:endolysin [Gordonia phage William]QDF17115.1 lysin A, L-Ala-D-Glu peptidase domain [Gordonia phage William]
MSFRTAYGNTHSENGWRMVNRDECVLIQGLAFMDTAPVRRGYAAEALSAWAHWYDQNVPGEITSPTWGWSNTNDVSTSNHLSGTALDINAPQYPWGGDRMARVFPDRVAAIRRGLAEFEGIIFWGADWSRKDEMHFQLNAGTASGDGASQRLAEFVQRRIVDGRLKGTVGKTAIDAARVNAFTQAFMTPIGSDTKDNREQLCGAGSRDAGEFDGWAQLGNRTFVDGLAAVLDRVVNR